MSFLDSFFIYKKFIPLFKENDKPTLKKDRFVINLRQENYLLPFLWFYNKCWGVEKHLNIFVVKNKKNVEQISKSYYNKVTTP